jgi:hypothetical protein
MKLSLPDDLCGKIMNVEDIPDKRGNYVDKAELQEALKVYITEVRAAAAAGLPRPKVPEYIGECILKIATNYSYSNKPKANFLRYPFREDMVMDGVETCIRYIHNYDPWRGTSPLAYFTQTCYFAFLNRIAGERKQLYKKFKAIQAQREIGIQADSQEHQELADFGVEIQDNSEYMNDFIRGYEDSAQKKRAELKGKKAKGATFDDVFPDEDDEVLPDIDDQDE